MVKIDAPYINSNDLTVLYYPLQEADLPWTNEAFCSSPLAMLVNPIFLGAYSGITNKSSVENFSFT